MLSAAYYYYCYLLVKVHEGNKSLPRSTPGDQHPTELGISHQLFTHMCVQRSQTKNRPDMSGRLCTTLMPENISYHSQQL